MWLEKAKEALKIKNKRKSRQSPEARVEVQPEKQQESWTAWPRQPVDDKIHPIDIMDIKTIRKKKPRDFPASLPPSSHKSSIINCTVIQAKISIYRKQSWNTTRLNRNYCNRTLFLVPKSHELQLSDLTFDFIAKHRAYKLFIFSPFCACAFILCF